MWSSIRETCVLIKTHFDNYCFCFVGSSRKMEIKYSCLRYSVRNCVKPFSTFCE